MSKYTIVIVENDEDEQFFMKEAFDASAMFSILSQFKNGNELIEWLDAHQASEFPDLILSDLNMPGKNGYDILEELNQSPKYADLPVIITSTSSVKSVKDKCMALNARDFIVKPETFMDYAVYVENLHKRIQQNHWVS